jgi:hypothetical protein
VNGARERLHTAQFFEFIADAPLEKAAPLFGAALERAWAPGWNPSFVWPAAGHDQEGMVFAYERTALDPRANDLVRRMADQDGRSGPEWASQVNGYLRLQGAQGGARD